MLSPTYLMIYLGSKKYNVIAKYGIIGLNRGTPLDTFLEDSFEPQALAPDCSLSGVKHSHATERTIGRKFELHALGNMLHEHNLDLKICAVFVSTPAYVSTFFLIKVRTKTNLT